MYEVFDVESRSLHRLHVSEMKRWKDRSDSFSFSGPEEALPETDPNHSASEEEIPRCALEVKPPSAEEVDIETTKSCDEPEGEDPSEDYQLTEPENELDSSEVEKPEAKRIRTPPQRFESVAKGRKSVRGRRRPRGPGGRRRRGQPPALSSVSAKMNAIVRLV